LSIDEETSSVSAPEKHNCIKSEKVQVMLNKVNNWTTEHFV